MARQIRTQAEYQLMLSGPGNCFCGRPVEVVISPPLEHYPLTAEDLIRVTTRCPLGPTNRLGFETQTFTRRDGGHHWAVWGFVRVPSAIAPLTDDTLSVFE